MLLQALQVLDMSTVLLVYMKFVSRMMYGCTFLGKYICIVQLFYVMCDNCILTLFAGCSQVTLDGVCGLNFTAIQTASFARLILGPGDCS